MIAIENKLGLKILGGVPGRPRRHVFSGLEDYPQGGAARTFSRSGLEKILKECGETEYHFYYPYPDYKFMTTLYSDRYLPKVGELSNNLRNFDRDRMLLFDEKKGVRHAHPRGTVWTVQQFVPRDDRTHDGHCIQPFFPTTGRST